MSFFGEAKTLQHRKDAHKFLDIYGNVKNVCPSPTSHHFHANCLSLYLLMYAVKECQVLQVKVKVAQLCLTLCDPWTIQSMEFFRPKYWSG